MQCFKVKSHEIVKRFDPYYYMPEFKNLNNKLLKLDNVVSIGSIIKSWNRGDGPREGFYTEDSTNGIYFIRVNNLKNHTIVLDDIKYINRHIHETKLKRAQVTSGDVVFAISGTKDNLGTVSIIPENIKEANLNSALVKINLDERKILKEYFCYFFDLPIARMQIDFIGKGAAQNNLNNEEISEIFIPLPSMERQKDVINLMKQAYLNKFTKEQEAENKLSDINSIILETLHIKFPEVAEKRCYSISSFDLRNNRMDTHYHQPKFSLLEEYLKNCNCDYKKIKDISYKISSGATPLSGGDSYTDNTGIPFIRSGDINKYDKINYTKTLYIKENVHNKMLRSSQLEYDDVLIAIVGATIGQVAVYKDKRPANINQALALIRVDKSKILPEYLKIYMLSKFGQEELNRNKRPVARANLNLDEIGNINILLPDLEHQHTIVNKYYKILEEIDALKKDAKTEFEKSKAKIEKMILGEE